MAKTKNKKKLADKIQAKRQSAPYKKQLNPFEVHINKEKMAVLGRKNKNDRGLPGVSRAKAIKKRKNTLLQEFKTQHKSNMFMDRRIGERDKDMTEDEKIAARFSAVRARAHHDMTFDLDDEEILTHKGQLLSEIDKFDDPRSDDDDADSFDGESKQGKTGRLESDFVEDAHFGGGIFKKTDKEGYKSHKDLINELIAESKKRKAEQQKRKHDTMEMTDQTNVEWKDLIPIIVTHKKNKEEEKKESEKKKVEDFDKEMREMMFEGRGQAARDRLKTEDEVAKEAKEKLEQLEKERLERMHGWGGGGKGQDHRGADDLDDDIVYESDPEYMLSYDKESGGANVTVEAQINGKKIGGKKSKAAAESGDDSDQDDADRTSVMEDDDEEEKEEDEEEKEEGEHDDEKEQDDDVMENESENGSEDDDLSDLKASSSSESEESDQETTESNEKATESEKQKTVNKDTDTNKNDLQGEKIRQDLLRRKEVMDKAREELPYTFEFPESYDSLEGLLKDRSSAHQTIIIERIIKCNHPSLAQGNKEKLGTLFAYLLQHLNDRASESKDEASLKNCFAVFTCLVPQMYELAQLNPELTQQAVKEVIKEKHEEYRKKKKVRPGLEMLIFLKLIGSLFSTSDFRHQVVTPAFVFMEQMLNKCRLNRGCDIAYGLFLAVLVLEYTSLSKRYLPGVVNFLGAILHMAIPKTGVKLIRVRPPFKSTSTLLVLTKNCADSDDDIKPKMELADLLETNPASDEFKIRVLSTALRLIAEYDTLLADLPSNIEIFEDIREYLKLIPADSYPKDCQNLLKVVSEQLDKRKSTKQLTYIKMAAAKPKALRLYEPKIEGVFYDGKRRKVQSREKAEREKLLYKLKKETKGAIREIKRDTAFLGRHKIRQQIRSDRERRDKVNKIYSEAAMQQSEFNKEQKTKKKK